MEHDPDETGLISFDKFKAVVTELFGDGEDFTDEEIKDIIGDALSQDGLNVQYKIAAKAMLGK